MPVREAFPTWMEELRDSPINEAIRVLKSGS